MSNVTPLFPRSGDKYRRAPGSRLHDQLVEIRRRSAAPLVHPAMTFEEFAELNAERIWDVLVIGDRRDVTFNQLAAEMWRQL